ncbi:MAG: hypothetical protein ACI8XV_001991, partial [Arenicella sp.]
MWTGTSALKNIDQTLQTIRNDVVRLDAELSRFTDNLADNQRQRFKIIGDIATVRLVEIERGELQSELSSADNRAAKLLQQRQIALSLLNQEIDTHNQQIVDTEQLRNDQLELVNEASQQIVDTEAKVQDQLKDDVGYLAKLDKARAAESIALEANEKVEDAQSDMAEKAVPYQADSLFMYLWERHYATTKYKAGLFARFMDGFVAKTINYEPARVNFWNLTEIPKRLAEHAASVTQLADDQHMAVQQFEINGLEKAGLRELESKLDGQRQQLDGQDDDLEIYEAQLNDKLEQRAKYVAGEDQYIVQSLTQLTDALDHQDLKSIHSYVLATNSPTDDQLVIELQGVDARIDALTEGLSDVRGLHDKKLGRLKELEYVRRDFKNSRFDDVRSGFANESLLVGVLGQFLQGVVNGSDLWRVIKRNQRYRNVGSTPDFGSGGLEQIGDLLGGGRVH